MPIIDHPLFQRLRRIHQLSLVSYVYPSANHTRFEHSLGVYHVTSHAPVGLPTRAYALLHDIGHPPFSHLLEHSLALLGHSIDHEEVGKRWAKEILQDTVFSYQEVFRNRENLVVQGGVGTDRIDYLIRDSYFTGIRIGFIQWDRLVRNMWVEDGKLFINEKVLSNAEHLYVARFILSDAVYFHKTILVLDVMFFRAVEELLNYYSPKELVPMDDYQLVGAFRSTENSWWKRIEERKLFKMVFRGREEDAREVYEKYVSRHGEDAVILWRRPRYYSKPDVYLEDGRTLLQASPLICSLKKAEEKREYWFVAVDPRILRP